MISRILIALGALAIPGAALAHPGHIDEAAGHSHWLALVILGGFAIAALGWGLAALARAYKRRSRA